MLSITIILLLRIVQHLFEKLSSAGIPTPVISLKYITIRQTFSSVFALLLVLFTTEISNINLNVLTVLLATLMAGSLALCTYSNLMALKNGTMVLASLFSMAGAFIPCVVSAILFNEPLTKVQIISFLVFLYAACLLVDCSREIYIDFNKKTLLLLLLSMTSNGCIMLSQKMFTFYVSDGNAMVFNFLAFALSAVFSLLLFLLLQKKYPLSSTPQKTHIDPNVIRYGLVLAATILLISQISTTATATIPSVILFPVSDGGGMLICAVVSAVVFKEKITRKSILGLALGTISLVFISL